jgi:large subunit ribosomal protein L21
MYAVIQTGGKQYRVEPGEHLRVEKLADAKGEALAKGASVTFENVLMVGGEGTPRVGKPFVSGEKVLAQVVAQDRAKKIIVFKFRRRKNYRRKYGHRQPFTELRISSIEG